VAQAHGRKALNVQRVEHGTARTQDSVPKPATQQKGSLWFESVHKKRKNKNISRQAGDYDATKKRLESRVVESQLLAKRIYAGQPASSVTLRAKAC